MLKILTLEERRSLKNKWQAWHKKRVEESTKIYDLEYYELVEELVDSLIQLNDENYDNAIRLHNEKMQLIRENQALKLELKEYRDFDLQTSVNQDRNRLRDAYFNSPYRLPKPFRTP